MKKTMAVLFIGALFVASSSWAKGVPEWNIAEEVMSACYGGWNGVITLDMGAGASKSLNSKEGAKSSFLSTSQNSEGMTTGTSFDFQNGDLEAGEILSVSDSAFEDSFYSDGDSHTRDAEEYTATDMEMFIGVKLTVPLYSREVRLKKQESKNRQVKLMADLYAKFEGYRATVAALNQQEKVVKQLMMDGGQQAIQGYYGMLVEREKSIALMRSAHRQIIGTLQGCGYRGK